MVNETTVGEFCPFTYGKGLPERARVASGEVPVYGSNGIVGYHNKALTSGPSVIVGRKGTVGAVHLSVLPCWPIDTTFYIEFESVPKARYAFYLLKTLGLTHMNSDSAVPGLNRDAAQARRITIVEEPQRDAIAYVLGALDDKIELNRRMNQTLEAMARAIFESWFVDFDPVRAKAEGQQPAGLKPELAALFPDAFENSELGEIPKGWRVGRLGDIIDIHDSKRIPLSSRERQKRQGTYRYYGAAGIVDYVDDFMFDGIYVLVGEDGSVVTTLGNPVLQYVWGKFWVNNHAHVIKATGGVTDEHLLLLLQQVYVASFVTGAVQPKLSQTNMKAIPVIHGSPELNEAFGHIVAPLYAKLRILHDEIGMLAAIRDALLPKLISGELRVPDAERIVGRTL